MSITIQNRTSGAAIYAVSSGLDHVKTTSSTAANGNCTIARNYNGNSGTIVAIEFLPDEKGNKYANSFCIRVKWDNGGGTNRYCWQEVLFGHNPSSTTTVGAIWEYQSGGSWHELGTDLVNVTPDAIRVSAKSGSSGINTDPITDLTFSGYWVSGRGYADQLIDGVSDTTVGSCSNPASWPYSGSNNEYYHYLSWKRPANSSQILYYVVPIWKGYTQSDDRNGSLGGLDIVSSTTFVYNSSWGISSGYKIRYTVHAVYAIGAPYPSFNQSAETKTELNTGSSGATSTASYAIWRQGGTGGKTVKLLQFYETSDRTKGGAEWRILSDSTNTDYSAPYIVGAPIVAPTEIKINGVDKSNDYSVRGWIRSNNSWDDTYNRPISWSTTEDVADSEHRLIKMPNYNFAYKQVLRAKERNLIMDHNDGTGNCDTRVVSIGEEYGIFPQLSRFGYDLVGWFTEAEGGTQVYPTTIMADGTTDVIIYAHWEEHWDTEINDLTFLHYEKPSVKIGVKRDSLENPEGVRLWVQGKLHPILDINDKDKNFVADITDIYWRDEVVCDDDGNIISNNRGKSFRQIGPLKEGDSIVKHRLFDSRTYYNWQTANSESDIIQGVKTNDYKTIPFETGILKDKIRTNSSATQRHFDLNNEFQFRCLLRDALQSYYDKTSDAYGEDYPYKGESYSPWGNYLLMPDNWSDSSNFTFQKKLKSKSSGISDASNDGDSALLLKYVTKLLVHNPYLDEVLKETRGTKNLRQQQNPPETDFWQIREHTQNKVNSVADLNSKLLADRSNEMSVNGFSAQEVKDFLIPTLKRALEENEDLVYDPSQINPVLNMLEKINEDHDKIARENGEYDEYYDYSGLEVGDDAQAAAMDASNANSRVLELDGERHQGSTNWIPVDRYNDTGSDNTVRDTIYKEVQLGNFDNELVEDEHEDIAGNTEKVQSTIDHITDYDISQLDLKNSLSDLIYILSRMQPRAEGSEGAVVSTFNTLANDAANKAAYWDSTTNKFKDSAFTNWIPSSGGWRIPENDLAEYKSAVEGTSILTGTESLDENNAYGENDFANNGCKAACMGLCTSGCYQTCVGGCHTACGNSCFFGCKTSCSSTCGASCGGSCGGNCSGTCAGKCDTACTTDCAVNCGSGCARSCTGGCGTMCHTACGSACKISCSTNCSGSCKNDCGGGCQGSCKLNCQGSCNTGCTQNCKSSCGSGCDSSCGGQCSNTCKGGCSTTCKNGCAEGCYTGCSGSCGNSCSTSCLEICGNECTGDCKDECSIKCTTFCSSGCTKTCNSLCKSGCTDSCRTGCEHNCKVVCEDACTVRCTIECSNSCKTICTGDCTEVCTNTCSSLCAVNCYATCSHGCRQDCKNDCNINCSQTCRGSCGGVCAGCGGYCEHDCEGACRSGCYSGCYTVCANSCTVHCTGECNNTCEDACSFDCGGKCNRQCTQTCATDCNTTCGSKCKNTCKNTCVTHCYNACQESCVINCKGQCTENCDTNCNKSCAKTCTVNCITSCTQLCDSSCDYNCGGGCGHNCGSACSSGCSTSCDKNCGTSCNKNCAKDCVTGCKTKCISTCSGSCHGGCSTACGQQCNSSCKGSCKDKCSTGCNATCQSDCNNMCKDACKDSCKSRCIGSCTADCKNQCNGDCTASCASDCSITCRDTCSTTCEDSCTTACGTACGTSCESSCYSSCHQSCTGFSYKPLTA